MVNMIQLVLRRRKKREIETEKRRAGEMKGREEMEREWKNC